MLKQRIDRANEIISSIERIDRFLRETKQSPTFIPKLVVISSQNNSVEIQDECLNLLVAKILNETKKDLERELLGC